MLTTNTNFHKNIPRLLPFQPKIKNMFDELSFHKPIERFNTTLQINYLILTMRATNLTTKPITSFDATKINTEFFTNTTLRSILIVNINNPNKQP